LGSRLEQKPDAVLLDLRMPKYSGYELLQTLTSFITKAFKFLDFREALKFVNHVGELAEEQGHHPDIFLAWGKVEVMTWTHKINGLTESDFILAAKIDQLRNS
jgi:pterin-4a-carbinolamine dehydratase